MDFGEFVKLDLEKKFGLIKPVPSYSTIEGPQALDRIKSLLERVIDPKNILNFHRKLEEPCKKCGEKEVYCGYMENGGADYHDNFWHICMNENCLDAKFYEHTVGNGSMEDPDDTKCPWCNYQHIAGFKDK